MHSAIARIGLIVCWLGWLYPFFFRAPHFQKRDSMTVSGPTRVGVLLEAVGVLLAFVHTQRARTHPAALLGAASFSVIGIVLSWTAVAHLGKQFRIHAGLYADHELVRTGPYRVVRHPIYASLLAMLLATIVLLTPWLRALLAVAVFLAGTEIRVRSEDRLLASRFGDRFADYRKRVPAYIPFVR